MQSRFILAAAVAALATPAAANTDPAPYAAPYALTAAHADFVTDLRALVALPGETGAAALRAAALMERQNAAQERVVLPLLGWTEDAAAGRIPASAAVPAQDLEAELAGLLAGDIALVTALVELFAAADTAGQTEVARLAERMIWHETSDIDVLYPAALLVSQARK